LSDKIIGEDGNAHTSFGVTVTGRLSSRESDVFNSGTDLQNQPKKIRDMFVPDDGQEFMSVDLKNAENRVQAVLAGMRRALEAFEADENVHLKVGEWIHGRRIDKKKEGDTYKRLKNIQHGTNYGMGDKTFATYVKKTVAEAKVLRKKYLEWVPELETWHEWVFAKVTSGDRTLVTPMGRKRTFTKPATDYKLRNEAYAHIPQSTVADIINIGGLGLWLSLPCKCRMVLQIHDEWVVSIVKSMVDDFKRQAKKHLETLREIEWDGRKMVIPVEFDGPKKNWRG
jgi:DNA polymerase I-like protein with 3'-5' exonuclease and polymerase domains